MSASTVQDIVQRHMREKRLTSKSREAPNKIFTEADELLTMRKIEHDPSLSATALAKEAEKLLEETCNLEMLRRPLRRDNFHGRTCRNKLPTGRKKFEE